MLLKRTGRAAIAFGVSLVLLVVSSLAFATSADAGTVDDEQLFIQMINQLRTDKGLNPLVVDGELTAQARAWSQSMAANDQLAHTSNLAGGISSPWTVLGENVGVHVIHDVSGLFQAFIASPSHYQNLVDPRFQYVGVGVVNTEAGKLWTTHRFMAATPPPTPAPPTTAHTPSTAAPTTAAPAPKPQTTAPPELPATPPTTPSPTPPTTTRPTTRPTPPSTTPAGDHGTGAPTTTDPTAAGPSTDREADPAATPTDDETSADPQAGPTPADREAYAELVKPDVATIEEVLIDLLAAGI